MLNPAFRNPDSEAEDRDEELAERLQCEIDAGQHDEEFGRWFRTVYYRESAFGGRVMGAFRDYLFEQASEPPVPCPEEGE